MQMIFPGVTLYRNFERIVGYEQLNPRFFVKKEDKEIVADCFAESFFLLYILSYRNEVPIQQKNATQESYCGEMELCYLYDLP